MTKILFRSLRCDKGRRVCVGQVPTGCGCLLPPIGGAFYPRITRVIHGPAQVLHAGPESHQQCDAFNAYAGSARQMVVQDATALGGPSLRINDSHALMDGSNFRRQTI